MDQKTTSQHITRAQNLRAMQTLVITMGGVKGYVAWLEAMPEGATISTGGVEQSTMMDIAANDDSYNKAIKAFAKVMAPVLAAL